MIDDAMYFIFITKCSNVVHYVVKNGSYAAQSLGRRDLDILCQRVVKAHPVVLSSTQPAVEEQQQVHHCKCLAKPLHWKATLEVMNG